MIRFSCLAALAGYSLTALVLLSESSALAQQPARNYKNIVNQRFHTISNGPQSALIVDVAADADAATTRAAVLKSYRAARATRDSIMMRELAVMRKNREVKPGRQFSVTDVAIVRRGGVLTMRAAPPAATNPSSANVVVATRAVAKTRSGGPPLTFTFPTTTATTSWTTTKAQQLTTLSNALVTELTNVLGAPAWSGNVTVLNSDPNLGTVNEILGALFIYDASTSTYEILMPSFSDSQTEFLAMAQTMAQAWHGPAMIGYDAWEKGMARTVAIIAANDLKTYPGIGTSIDPSNGFYYTPDYDLLNQAPLGNSTFTPPTIGAESGPTVNPTQYGGMIIPRLQMSGSAWLKCYIENPSFFQTFNTAYIAEFAIDPTVANDTTRLATYAASALPNGVEGVAFNTWYEQQYVLDTSITVGAKIYAHTSATFPDATSGAPAGAAVYLIYYLTTTTGDEQNLNGISQVIYWDYSFLDRLSLASFGTVTIADGFGTVAPYFQGIGGTPADQMRVAMDFPVNKEYVRVYFPAGQTGTASSPNSFSGVVTGQDSGSLVAVFNTAGSINTSTTAVQQGAFGNNSSVGTGFSRATFTLSLANTPTVTFKRNMYIDTGNITPIFQFAALGTTATLNTTFSNGVQMVSLPIKPLGTNLAASMGASTSSALIAQFRQDNTIGIDQYLRYPNLPAYQPGYAFWTDFPAVTTPPSPGITGVPYDPISQPNVSVGLQFGWNQIGSPYNTALDITLDAQFQYAGGSVFGYSDAVANGLIAAGVIGYNSTNGYEDITNASNSVDFPTNQLTPWIGYWINVTQAEGVTLTFLSPQAGTTLAARTKNATSRAAASPLSGGGWMMPIKLMDGSGRGSIAYIGQSRAAASSYKSSVDTAAPPTAPGGTPVVLRLASKQGYSVTRGAPGNLMTDLRPLNAEAEWDFTATYPAGKQSYMLAWSNMALLPHGTRLTLVDVTTGAQQSMNSSPGYTFQTGANETTRQFQIIAQPRSIGRMQVSNVSATMPRLAGRAATTMTITYNINTEGSVTSTISMNGRVLRHLAQASRAVTSGLNEMVWDLRDDQGRNVSAGTYMLQIVAQGTNGDQTRSIVPLNVVR